MVKLTKTASLKGIFATFMILSMIFFMPLTSAFMPSEKWESKENSQYDKFIVEDWFGLGKVLLTADLEDYKEECIGGTQCEAKIKTEGKDVYVDSIAFYTWDIVGSPNRQKVPYKGEINYTLSYKGKQIIINAEKPADEWVDWVVTLSDGKDKWTLNNWAWWSGYGDGTLNTTLLTPTNASTSILSPTNELTFSANATMNSSLYILNSSLYIWNESSYNQYWNTTNLVAWYQFDDNTANDYFGVNNGTNSGAYQSAQGKIGGSAVFDGVDDSINTTLSSNSAFNGINGFTLSAWINPINIGETNGEIISKEEGTSAQLGFKWYLASSNRLSVQINGQTGILSSTNAIIYGQWQHVLVIINNTGYVSYYVNGIYLNSGQSSVGTNNITTTKTLTIGQRTDATDRTFNGSIDDVRIYNISLTASQIADLYNIEKLQYNDTMTGSNDGLTVEDMAGSNDGTKVNGTITNSSYAKIGLGGAGFDGDNDYIKTASPLLGLSSTTVSFWYKKVSEIPQDSSVRAVIGGTEYTTKFWSIQTRDSSADNGLYIRTSATFATSITNISVGSWQHITIVLSPINATHGYLIRYLNGTKIGTGTDIYADCGTDETGSLSLDSSIGGLGGLGVNGSLDEIMIYNRSLDATEIASLYANTYTNTTDLVAYYNFDQLGSASPQFSVANLTDGKKFWNVFSYDSTMTFGAWQSEAFETTIDAPQEMSLVNPTDASGSNLSRNYIKTNMTYNFTNFGGAGIVPMNTNGLVAYYPLDYNANDYFGVNNGTEYNNPLKSLGYTGGAYQFTGTTNYDQINMGDVELINTTFTLSAWIYPKSTGTQSIVSKWYASATNRVYLFQISAGQLSGGVSNDGNFATANSLLAGTIKANQWQFVTMTFNSGDLKLYINGTQIGNTTTTATSLYNSGCPLTIGISRSATSQYSGMFNGSIDDVKVYNRTLSPQEIYEEYQMTKNISSTPSYNELTNLSDGTKYFRGVACDNVNNLCNYSEIYNVTLDATAPNIAITYPIAINYTTNITELNYSVTETNPNSCWYSTDSGTTNSTSVTSGENFTDVTSTEGTNTWIVYCNDTVGNVGSDSVTFFKDSINPAISLLSPENDTNSSSSYMDFEWIVNEINPHNNTLYVFYENDSIAYTNTTILQSYFYDMNVPTAVYCFNPFLNNSFLFNSSVTPDEIKRTICTESLIPSGNVFIRTDMVGRISDLRLSTTLSDTSPNCLTETYQDYNGRLYTTGNIGKYFCIYDLISQGYFSGQITGLLAVDFEPFETAFKDVLFADGIYTWNVTAFDLYGNSNSTETRTFTIDATAPVITITLPEAITYNVTSLNLDIDAEDEIVGQDSCWYSLNGESNISLNKTGDTRYQSTSNITIIAGENEITYFCNDTVGNVGSESVIFYGDETDPVMSIIYPTANLILDSGTNIALNYTSSDNNINTCWYSLDSGTNTSFTSCSTNTTFNSSVGDHYLYVYGNDTFGNEGISTRVNFTIINVSTSYGFTNPAMETYNDTFYNIVNASSSVSVTGTLYYEGTAYSMTNTSNNFSYSFNIPYNTNLSENNSVIYSMNFTYNGNSQVFNRTSVNQTVYKMFITSCNTTYAQTTLNFTTKDADTLTTLTNSDIAGTFYIWLSGNTIALNRSYTFDINNDTDGSFPICLSPNWSAYQTDAVIYYDKTGYASSTYIFDDDALTNATQNITLYMIAGATDLVVRVYDSNLVVQKDIIIKMLKFYPATNTWTQVEMGTTDALGQALFHVTEKTVDYNFFLLSGDTILDSTGSMKVVCFNTPCVVELTLPSETDDIFTYYTTVDGLSYALTYDNDTKVFSFTYASDDESTMQLEVFRMNGTGSPFICNESSTGTAGILTCNISEYTEGVFVANAYKIGSKYILETLTANLGMDYEDFGMEGVFWSALTIIALVFVGIFNPTVSIGMLIVGVIAFAFFGIIALPISAVISIIILGGLVISQLKT